MSDCTGDLARLLESDLLSSGWDPAFCGPRTVSELSYQATLESLSSSLLKKYIPYEKDDGKLKDREVAALALFLQNNEDCRTMAVGPDEAWSKEDKEKVSLALGEMEIILDDFCHPNAGRGILLSLGEILSHADTGPGASVGVHNNDFYTKLFDSPLSYTKSELLEYYLAYISYFPDWRDAEKSRHAMHGFRNVPGSRLFFAPKTRKISRVACTEASLNMFYQKGIQSVLESRLKKVFGIDLRGDREHKFAPQQDKNRELARLGSIYGTFGTIDLSSASDRISCNMVERFFPETTRKWLELTRSAMTHLPNGSLQELYMFSSMGNAFTFPLETTIFASVVAAAYRVLGIPLERPRGTALGNFAVFGDDIIVVTEAYDLVCKILHSLGHRVNSDKSFNYGLFRESCGSDYFAGRNIRGVYLKRLQRDVDFFKAINRLNIWSGRHGIVLEKTIPYLLSQCRRRLYVPMHEQDTAGIRTPLHCLRKQISPSELGSRSGQQAAGSFPSVRSLGSGAFSYSYKCLRPREDTVLVADAKSLFRNQFKTLLRNLGVVSPVNKADLRRLQDYLESSDYFDRRFRTRLAARGTDRTGDDRDRRGGPSVAEQRCLAQVRYNSSGVLLSALAGRLRDGSFSVRDFSKRTVTRVCHSSCWDYVGPELAKNGELAEGFLLLSLVNLGEVN